MSDPFDNESGGLKGLSYSAGWLLTNSARFLATNTLILGVSFVSGIAAARLLGPAGKGLIFIAVLTASTLAQVFGGSIGYSLQFHVGRSQLDARAALRLAATYAAVVGGGLVVALLTLRDATSALVVVEFPPFVWWIVPVIPLEMLTQSLYPVLVAIDRVRLRNLIEFGRAILTLLALLLLVGLARVGLVGAAQAVLIGVGASTAAATLVLAVRPREMRVGPPTPLLSVLRFGLQQHGGAVLARALKRLDAFFLLYFLGPGAVGVYSVASNIAEPPLLLGRSAHEVAISFTATNEKTYAGNVVARLVRWGGPLALFLHVTYAVSILPLIDILYGQDFRGAALPALLLLWGTLCLNIYNILAGYLVGAGRARLMTYAMAVSAAVNIPMSLLLIPRLGLAGNALATVAASVVALVVAARFFRLESQQPLRELLLSRKEDIGHLRRALRSLTIRRGDGSRTREVSSGSPDAR